MQIKFIRIVYNLLQQLLNNFNLLSSFKKEFEMKRI